jgi:hypothetical protein
MRAAAKEKHRIKAIDRLLGNVAVQGALSLIYGVIAHWLLKGMTRPVVLVDWTGCGPDLYLLRAGVPIGGRAVLLHATVVSKKKLSNPKVHEKFLDTLATIMPKHCKPIIVTDGGFYFHWFNKVESLGWDFVGRLRGKLSVRFPKRTQLVTELLRLASRKPKFFGLANVGGKQKTDCNIVLASKPKPKGRTRLTQKGKRRRGTDDIKHSAAAREPWLLATSLHKSARKIVAIYAARMQIEESFRDLKSPRFGWAFGFARSKNPRRIEVMLMIATLASLATLAVGIAGERAGLAAQFQANTLRHRRVLSLSNLGRRIISTGIGIADAALRHALIVLRRALQLASPIAFAPI